MHLLILRFTVSASKFSFNFFYIFEHYNFQDVFVFFPYFYIEPSTSMYFLYVSGMRCFSSSPKKTHLMLLFFIAFFTLRFLVFVVDRVQEFPDGCFSHHFWLLHAILDAPLLPQILADVRNCISLGWVRVQSSLKLFSSSLAYHCYSPLVLVFKIWFLVI